MRIKKVSETTPITGNIVNKYSESTTDGYSCDFLNKIITGGSQPNIFVQTTEPETKKGIWLQAEREIEHIYGDEDIFIAGTWEPDGRYANIPYDFYWGAVCLVGTNIYLFGDESYPYNVAYKYNTLTDTYTQLTNVPYDFARGSAVAIGTDIYLLGSYISSNNRNLYKYNTLTDTYTQLSNIPYSFHSGSAVAIGTDIYLLGSGSSTYYRYNYKYDTLTDTYTQLSNIPIDFYDSSAVAIGTNIYLMGTESNGYYNRAYKYNTLTDTYTRLADIPFSFYQGSSVSFGTDIYLFGGGSSPKITYKYNTLNNTYTRLNNIPYNFLRGGATITGTKIYLIGGIEVPKKIQVLPLESKTYQNNSLVIAQGKYNAVGYEVDLIEDDRIELPLLYAFADAWFYTTTNGIETNIPTYYGNGTNWIKIKN